MEDKDGTDASLPMSMAVRTPSPGRDSWTPPPGRPMHGCLLRLAVLFAMIGASLNRDTLFHCLPPLPRAVATGRLTMTSLGEPVDCCQSLAQPPLPSVVVELSVWEQATPTACLACPRRRNGARLLDCVDPTALASPWSWSCSGSLAFSYGLGLRRGARARRCLHCPRTPIIPENWCSMLF